MLTATITINEVERKVTVVWNKSADSTPTEYIIGCILGDVISAAQREVRPLMELLMDAPSVAVVRLGTESDAAKELN